MFAYIIMLLNLLAFGNQSSFTRQPFSPDPGGQHRPPGQITARP